MMVHGIIQTFLAGMAMLLLTIKSKVNYRVKMIQVRVIEHLISSIILNEYD